MDLSNLRKDYRRGGLREEEVAADPIAQFGAWFDEALASGDAAPDAMTLATADARGRPSARTVLLKGFDSRGFVFYTNYESRKGRELEENPFAALLFFWPSLERQVRLEGPVVRVSAEESDAYFATRPLGSRIGAVASAQSRPLATRDALDRRVREIEAELAGRDVLPRPDYWGGYRLAPDAVELWQGRQSRLHDRLLYTRSGEGWTIVRLSP